MTKKTLIMALGCAMIGGAALAQEAAPVPEAVPEQAPVVVEQAPVVVEAPVVEEAPVVVEQALVEEAAPVVVEAPVVEEVPVVEAAPVVVEVAPAPEAEECCDGWSYTPGEGISFDEEPIMTAEFGLAFDSKYMTYGVIDGKDPIVTPSATATFFDWVYFGVEAIYDTTKQQGRKWGGYGNRAGKYTTLDAIVGVAHDFDLGETLGALSVDFNYIYEYLPRYHGEVGDTQYLNLELALNDLWLEPTFAIERDLMADDGTYFNFNVGHTFTLIGDEEDTVLTFKPSVGQGFGNGMRNKGYLGKDKEGFMDTCIKGEFEWTLTEWLSLGAYVAYYDYWFDRRLRDGARDYNAEWGHDCDKSYNVVAGVALTATF